MRILDRYVTFTLAKNYLLALLVFCFLFILGDLTGSLDEIINLKVPLSILAEYYLHSLPAIIVQTSVIACLVAVLLTYGHMNQSNEVIAMRAGGLNFWDIGRPAVILGLTLSIIIFWTSEHLVPMSAARSQEIKKAYMTKDNKDKEQKKKSGVIDNMTFYGFDNRLFFIEKFNPNTSLAQGVIIITYDENQDVREKIVALEGKWNGSAWSFTQCQVSSYERDSSGRMTSRVKAYPEKIMDLKETPRDFLEQQVNMASLNIKQLKSYIERFDRSGAGKALQNLKVDLNAKIAFPFGNFVIIFVGLPFALMTSSRKKSIFASFGIALVIGFFYFVINAIAIAFGKAGILPPILAAWISPLLFIGIGILAIESDFSN